MFPFLGNQILYCGYYNGTTLQLWNHNSASVWVALIFLSCSVLRRRRPSTSIADTTSVFMSVHSLVMYPHQYPIQLCEEVTRCYSAASFHYGVLYRAMVSSYWQLDASAWAIEHAGEKTRCQWLKITAMRVLYSRLGIFFGEETHHLFYGCHISFWDKFSCRLPCGPPPFQIVGSSLNYSLNLPIRMSSKLSVLQWISKNIVDLRLASFYIANCRR